jgi:molybdopterin-guanine dinucleotide biosynthesis protein A
VRMIVRSRLHGGAHRTGGYFRRVRARLVPWREITRAGFSPHIFVNMNTPADYEAAKRMLRG